MALVQQDNKKAIVWSKTTCPYCVKAKRLLEQFDIEYEERIVGSITWSKDDLLQAVPNATTVPQIFIENEYIGGYRELVQKLTG